MLKLLAASGYEAKYAGDDAKRDHNADSAALCLAAMVTIPGAKPMLMGAAAAAGEVTISDSADQGRRSHNSAP